MSKPISLYYPENNQRIVFFENGYAISRIRTMFSHGIEILVFKWELRQPSCYEKLKVRLGLIKDNFFYNNLGDVTENLAESKNWNGRNTYDHLTPEEESAIFAAIQKYDRKRNCEKCDKLAVGTREIGFRSLKVQHQFCQEHLTEWDNQMQHFRDVHEILVGS